MECTFGRVKVRLGFENRFEKVFAFNCNLKKLFSEVIETICQIVNIIT